jgi:hypothetical protein
MSPKIILIVQWLLGRLTLNFLSSRKNIHAFFVKFFNTSGVVQNVEPVPNANSKV